MKAAILSVSVALCLAGPIATSAAFAQATGSDTVLDSRIEKRVHRDATLKKYDVHVSVADGVATLTGTVPTEADRSKATLLATVPGISKVNNQIVVDVNAGRSGVKGTAGKIEDKTKDAAEATKDAAVKAADKTKEGLSKTGEVITDGWITTRVKSKFIGEDLLKDSDIDVDTKDHVVTLNGTVMSAAARARAVAQAKEVEGVHRVVNKLTIGAKK